VTMDVANVTSAMGDKDAKVTLVEFSDYQCPFCKRVRPTIWRLVDEYKGKLRYVFMDFPLSFHKDAKKAAEAARCAGDQGKYFEMNRKLFDNQDKIGIGNLKGYAKELGLDVKKFDKCLDDGAHTKDIEASIAKGSSVGVSGTPAYFINGIMISGAQPYESFKELIDSELKR
jgi:protein-disulfide isomerase